MKYLFYSFLALSIVAPLVIAGMQIYYTHDELSFDIAALNNWLYAVDTFALPINAFKILVAITTALGLYYKISQTERQINQSELRDTFAMYIEHRKYIFEALDENISSIKNGDILCVQRSKFYISMFPENEPAKMESYDFTTKGEPIEFNSLNSALLEIFNHVEVKREQPTEKLIEHWIRLIEKDFSPFGFSFNPLDFSVSGLIKVIEVSSFLIEVLNFYSKVDSYKVEVQIRYFNRNIKDMILQPYAEQIF